MLKSLLLTAAAALLAASLSFADQTPSKIIIPVNRTAADKTASRCTRAIARHVTAQTARVTGRGGIATESADRSDRIAKEQSRKIP